MPRPVKRRRVCHEPKINLFGPYNQDKNIECVTMTVEEYEAIRLIDYENLTQEECAKVMNVARTTVQKIYEGARGKIAAALVNGRRLRITGGNYDLCANSKVQQDCFRKNCRQFRNRKRNM